MVWPLVRIPFCRNAGRTTAPFEIRPMLGFWGRYDEFTRIRFRDLYFVNQLRDWRNVITKTQIKERELRN